MISYKLADGIKRSIHALCRDRGAYLVAGSAALMFALVFGLDISKSEPFWKDLRDVRTTFAPFMAIMAFAIGAATTVLARRPPLIGRITANGSRGCSIPIHAALPGHLNSQKTSTMRSRRMGLSSETPDARTGRTSTSNS